MAAHPVPERVGVRTRKNAMKSEVTASRMSVPESTLESVLMSCAAGDMSPPETGRAATAFSSAHLFQNVFALDTPV
jgi:hypothetical protein